MSDETVRLVLATLLIAGGMRAATAETATESVTVTGSHRAFHDFTRTFAAPTQVTGKVARWERRICPLVAGQSSSYTRFVAQRVQYVALAAGAPVNTDASCAPNVEIVFTTAPQDLVNTVRQRDPDLLGYAASSAQRDALAKVTRPIQAWYATETTDLKGRHHLDNGRSVVNGNSIISLGSHATELADLSNSPGNILDLPPFYASTGNHLNDGIHSGFNHVLIVIDSTKLAGQDIVPLSDYIAMLALAQFNSLDACQELPSIVNRMAPACGHAVDGLTQFDLAYLEALYHVTAGRNMRLQLGEIGDRMTDRLEKISR
jgi:hypothetical protein